MKKSLFVLAIASAFASSVALADGEVTIYGQANVSIDSVNNGFTATNGVSNSSATATQVSSNSSRLGLKGAEDLGGGLSAIWQLESQINFDGTSTAGGQPASGNTLASRDTFAGLSSTSLGTVILGRHDTPFKMAGRSFDVFADNIADNRSLMGINGIMDARLNNVIAYVSPSMSGFTFVGAYVAGGEAATGALSKATVYSLAGLYSGGPWNAAVAYQSIQFGDPGTGDFGAASQNIGGLGATSFGTTGTAGKVNSWRLGGGYTSDNFQVNLVYDHNNANTTTAANSVSQNTWYVSGKFNVTSNDVIKAAYTKAGTWTNVQNDGAKQTSIGYDHLLSKHTTVYALYTKLTNDTSAAFALDPSGGFSTSGFSPTSGSAVLVGSDPSAFSIGMKHSF